MMFHRENAVSATSARLIAGQHFRSGRQCLGAGARRQISARSTAAAKREPANRSECYGEHCLVESGVVVGRPPQQILPRVSSILENTVYVKVIADLRTPIQGAQLVGHCVGGMQHWADLKLDRLVRAPVHIQLHGVFGASL